jgi:leader peptidase (prepilin peptidase)/N-methyltransferase
MITAFHLLCGASVFVMGAVVGSFLNVCIYRLPWEKSVIWPASHCPECLSAIAPRDNIPILSWLALRGECRSCHVRIPVRYALVELLVGVLFVGVYIADIGRGGLGPFAGPAFAQLGYHLILVAFLVAAIFTDVDYQVIPDPITFNGMLLGLALGALFPDVRQPPAGPTQPGTMNSWDGAYPAIVWALAGWVAGWILQWLTRAIFGSPSESTEKPAETESGVVYLLELGWPLVGAVAGWELGLLSRAGPWGGLVVGVQGLVIGGGLVWFFRVFGGLMFRKEAMGFGDVTLLAMIGSFLGWQAAVLSFFIGSFLGLVPALWKILVLLAKLITRRKSRARDRELPFGPYMGMAALLLVLTWSRVWPNWAAPVFQAIPAAVLFMLTGQV